MKRRVMSQLTNLFNPRLLARSLGLTEALPNIGTSNHAEPAADTSMSAERDLERRSLRDEAHYLGWNVYGHW